MLNRSRSAASFAVVIFSLAHVLSSAAIASAHHMFEEAAENALAAGSDESGSWNHPNDPTSWSNEYNYKFDELKLTGRIEDHQPWSDVYWPSRDAGIAARWNWAGNNGFKYRTFSESEVRAMSKSDLARLSPAEKYDIFMGHFEYPTVREIRGGTNPHAEYWAGICHGWSPAALNVAEPAAVEVAGPSGIVVPFGSDDVKALIDQYYADNAKASTFLGLKCQSGEGGSIFRRIASPFLNGEACQDVNAGALHVILTNELGIKHSGFVADVDPKREVWNQPVYGYDSKVMGYRSPQKDAAPGTVREVIMHTEMLYADELDKPLWTPVVGTADFKAGVEKYDYALELDSSGRIIGGQWISANRPDFLWNATKLQYTGYMSGLDSIYRAAAVAR